jgi:cysteine-S-conjugate beta-lyase
MMWDFDEIIPREGTGSIKYDLRREIFGNPDVIPMWVADMDFRTPDFILKALETRLAHGIMGYTFRTPEYFSSIATWVLISHGWKIENDWICFSPGIVPALNLCTLAFTRPGDSIIVQPPVYTPFFSAVESHGRNLVINPLREQDGKWVMDFEGLESMVSEKTKMIILSNPHNPVGRAWTEEELRQLAGICLRNNVLILSDEIHSDLVLPGNRHMPVAGLSDEIAEITVTCMAPSKTFNLAGLSTSSVIISNPVLRKYFSNKIEHLHVGYGNIFGTVASVAAYSEGREWLGELLEYIDKNVNLVMDRCRQSIPGIIPVRPEATYMIWLDCRKLGMKGPELSDFFINKAGIGLNEGSQFGHGGEGFMRMNIAAPRSVVEKAMDRLAAAVSGIRQK